ncbi:hypothetical protein EWM64_g4511 [Hericium alpestre]|uniref:Uncharacterized protein n=1 Tax=Hericium alpestre TaxID=135208 RepID=A0A4Y9ZZX8_9AGAM|nr:hypothetical protein EWM64_g4511 [Hericium alpestre]
MANTPRPIIESPLTPIQRQLSHLVTSLLPSLTRPSPPFKTSRLPNKTATVDATTITVTDVVTMTTFDVVGAPGVTTTPIAVEPQVRRVAVSPFDTDPCADRVGWGFCLCLPSESAYRSVYRDSPTGGIMPEAARPPDESQGQ